MCRDFRGDPLERLGVESAKTLWGGIGENIMHNGGGLVGQDAGAIFTTQIVF
jgi:hypothetical protein